MSDFTFNRISGSDERTLDVIFIHGLTGDPHDTWTTENGETFWPEWLCTDFPEISLYSMGYPASLFVQWAKKEMNLFERAGSALDYMVSKGIGERPILFVTHSLGGLLAKSIILRSCDAEDEDWLKVCNETRGVIFLATPHTGASLASTLTTLVPQLASQHIDVLSNVGGILDDLTVRYRKLANENDELVTSAYYEKYNTKKVALVVTKESADPGVKNTQPVAVDSDHISICKPKDKDSAVYLGIKRHIKRTLDRCPKPTGPDSFEDIGYAEKTDHDRRDLMEKLVDAGREHEYKMANNYQNEFARRYSKLGLYTAAREDNDRLLSEIEQRFVTHIYHPLICKKASDDAILYALQSNVIDPIYEKWKETKGFTTKTILQALYFLTEQCHIRWDAEA